MQEKPPNTFHNTWQITLTLLMSLFEVFNIKHCHVFGSCAFACSSSLSCNCRRLDYSMMSLLTSIFFTDRLVVANMRESLHHLTLESSELSGWAGEWQRVTWPLEIDKKMPRANQSDNTRFISVNSDRSPSLTNLRPCLISSHTHTHT